jgi:hypothetical protein
METKLFLNDEMIVSHKKISHYESVLYTSSSLIVYKSFIVTNKRINLKKTIVS